MNNRVHNDHAAFSFLPDREYGYVLNERREVAQQMGSEPNTVGTVETTHIAFQYKMLAAIEQEPNVVVNVDSVLMTKDVGEGPVQRPELFKGAAFKLSLSRSGQVRKMLNENGFLRPIFERVSHLLPEAGISTGSTWEGYQPWDVGVIKNVRASFKCDSMYNGIGYISTYTEVEQDVTAHNTTIHMKGSEEGKIEIDVLTGMLIREENVLHIAGETQLGPLKMLMNVKRRTTIERDDHKK